MTSETMAFEHDPSTAPVVVHAVSAPILAAALDAAGPLARAYATACGFKAGPGQILIVPAGDGTLARVLFGIEPDDGRRCDRFLAGKLAAVLPPGDYAFADGFPESFLAALALERSAYWFTRFREHLAPRARLAVPRGVDAAELARVSRAIGFGRDLINRPANDLSPDALEQEVRALGERHGAEVTVIAGEELGAGFPMIHAVGRAAAEGLRPQISSGAIPVRPRSRSSARACASTPGASTSSPNRACSSRRKTWAVPPPRWLWRWRA